MMLLIFAHHIFMHSPCICSLFSFLFLAMLCFCSFSLSLFQIDCAMERKQHKSTSARNPLPGSESFSSDLPFHIWFHDEKAYKDFFENYQAHGVHPERQVTLPDLPTLYYPISFELGDGNLFVRNSCSAPSCLFRSFTLTYMASIPPCLSLLCNLEVLHVPRVVHPDYPSCDRLWTVSRDELISHFCETCLPYGW